MKRILLLAALLCSCLAGVQAQQLASATVLQTAKLAFQENSFDFGDIYQGQVVEHVFVFENTGTAPLVISNVSTTCGCTATDWSRNPIMPGKKGEIKIEFNSTGKMGIQNKVITIISNAENPQEKVRITVNVLQKTE